MRKVKIDDWYCIFDENEKPYILCRNRNLMKFGLDHAVSPEDIDIRRHKVRVHFAVYEERPDFEEKYGEMFYLGPKGLATNDKQWPDYNLRITEEEKVVGFGSSFVADTRYNRYPVMTTEKQVNAVELAMALDFNKVKGALKMAEKSKFKYMNMSKLFVSEERKGPDGKNFRTITCPLNTYIGEKDVSGFKTTLPVGFIHEGYDLKRTGDDSFERIPNEHVYTFSIPEDWEISLVQREKNAEGEWETKDTFKVSASDYIGALKAQAKNYEQERKANQKTISVEMNSGDKGFVKKIQSREGVVFYAVTCPPNTYIGEKDVSGYRFTTRFANEVTDKNGNVKDDWKRVSIYKDADINLRKMKVDENDPSGYSVADEITVKGIDLASSLLAQSKEYQASRATDRDPFIKTEEGRKTAAAPAKEAAGKDRE